jgi:hypothetical protein
MPANGEGVGPVSVIHANTYTLGQLESGGRYHIYVTANNRYGTGDPSNVVTVTTEGDRVKVFSSTINNNQGYMPSHVPYWAQPIFVIPIAIAVVIIAVVLIITRVCVKKMRPPSPDYADGFNTLSKNFAYTGTQRFAVDPNMKPLMAGNMGGEGGPVFPTPYATMPMRQNAEDPWDRPLPNPRSHIYDNPQ